MRDRIQSTSNSRCKSGGFSNDNSFGSVNVDGRKCVSGPERHYYAVKGLLSGWTYRNDLLARYV